MEEKHVGVWHVSASTFYLFICPFWEMALCIFLFSQNLKSNTVIFVVTNQFRRYLHLFNNFVEEYSVELKAMEVNNGDLGTRIYKKGAERMVSSGFTVYHIII